MKKNFDTGAALKADSSDAYKSIPISGPNYLPDGPGDRLRIQHRGSPAPLPTVRKLQETYSHVGHLYHLKMLFNYNIGSSVA